MGEVAQWDALRPRIAELDPQRVENALGEGTPDVNYTRGMLELKSLPEWPKRAHTPVRVAFRRGQVPWLIRRWAHGGLCWVMLRAQGEWLLFPGSSAQLLDAGRPRYDLYNLAWWRADNSWSPAERQALIDILKGEACA